MMFPAHPRSRGENFERYASKGSERGSSPLTRGKRERRVDGGDKGRLIPAHAGKTHYAEFNGTRLWAHPRSRGENNAVPLTDARASGSSPLTRGKQIVGLDKVAPQRLIPAHAGKTP